MKYYFEICNLRDYEILAFIVLIEESNIKTILYKNLN